MAQKRGVGFGVAVIALVALGGVLFFSIRDLSAEINDAAPRSAGGNALQEAARRGDVAAINAAVQRGAGIDEATPEESGRSSLTPLMAAASTGQLDALKALLAGGAKVNTRANDGKTALMYAAGWGGPESVRALLDADARVDERTEDRWNALMFAAVRGQTASVKALLDAGAQVDVANKWGQTALMAAARSGEPEKVELLLIAGSNVNAVDVEGLSALNLAAGSDAPIACLRLLLEARADLNHADADGVTPIMRAAQKGDMDKAMLLLNAGADAKATDKQGWNAAAWARSRDDDAGRAIAKVLDEAGGN